MHDTFYTLSASFIVHQCITEPHGCIHSVKFSTHFISMFYVGTIEIKLKFTLIADTHIQYVDD